ncbi:MAG: class I SAM-dependent methyltransferase [Patescibacteria group bacterium]
MSVISNLDHELQSSKLEPRNDGRQIMDSDKLTDVERTTLESYRRIASARSQERDRPDFWRPEFERFIRLLPDGQVLDIGCGSGRDAAMFLEHGYGYVGIDLCETMLSLARRRNPSANFCRQNIYDLAFQSHSFAGFWAVTSLLHLPKARIAAALREIRRVTAVGGVGFVVMKGGNGERLVSGKFLGDERFYAYYSLVEFGAVLADSDFEVLEQERKIYHTSSSGDSAVWLKYFVRVSN